MPHNLNHDQPSRYQLKKIIYFDQEWICPDSRQFAPENLWPAELRLWQENEN
jgi:hypothetical protein